MNIQQVRNIVTYYILKMIQADNIPNHINRDIVEFNKKRGEYCGVQYEKYEVLKFIHQSDHIVQINSVPENSICCIDKKKIPNATAGIQLIINLKEKKKHVVIQKKYQSVCYNYFKIRHYPDLCKRKIQEWLLKQTWFFPNVFKTNIVLKHILQSNFCDEILNEIQLLL